MSRIVTRLATLAASKAIARWVDSTDLHRRTTSLARRLLSRIVHFKRVCAWDRWVACTSTTAHEAALLRWAVLQMTKLARNDSR
jgi:hypothetical protein